MSDQTNHHISVLRAELLRHLALKNGDIAIDCTVGAGGHTEGMLHLVGESGRVLGIDRDTEALRISELRLASHISAGQLSLTKAKFSELGNLIESLHLRGKVAGICADIGVSSMHLDQQSRGFSLRMDGPLDMRMDQSQDLTAADIVSSADEATLTGYFRDFGEEPKAKQIARAIVGARRISPIETTTQLSELVRQTVSYRTPSRKHPATRVFQALRIVVNDELNELDALLDFCFMALRPKGRLGVISFHSLEDRLIKNKFIAFSGQRERGAIPKDLPLSEKEIQARLSIRANIIKPFPIVPTTEELDANPRARSAKLRVLEKV